ncbi:MAG TPA: EAL domain-containing protein [Steroidobacteraceae bacterium]|nr:EAL domain-containing protein [Steroidobacteraceae bacterium]
MAARSAGAPALTAVSVNEPVSIPALGQQLRAVLPERRLHSVSLWDHEGNVLWLSEGALGPDENMLVLEAIEQLTTDLSLPCQETSVEDGRLAVFLPVRAPSGAPVGVAMILAESKSVGDDTLERLTAGPVRAIMQRLAVLLKPAAPAADGPAAAIPVLDLDLDPDSTQPAVLPAPPAEPPPEPAPEDRQLMTSEEIDDILELELAPDEPIAVTPVSVTPRGIAPVNGRPANLPPASPAAARNTPRPVPAVPAAAKAALAKAAPAKAAPAKVAPAKAAPTKAAPVTRAPPPPPAHADEPASENSRSDMVRLEFIPEPPVVNAAPIQLAPATAATTGRLPRPAAAVAPAPPVAVPRPARVLPPPEVPVPAPAPVATTRNPVPAPDIAPATSSSVVHGAADSGPPLNLLPFAKLRAGGQTRRFQVQLRGPTAQRDPAVLDALVLQRLVGWLGSNRAAWTAQPTSFTVNLSIATLEDEHFAHKVGAVLNASGIAGETLGFEIAESLCAQRRALVERFLVQCEKLGAWVVIDDFSLDSQVLPLLCSKAVRLLKIDPRLTSTALRDKLAQATVVATLQAAKVLGIHCSAKKVDSPASLQWLTAIGCDFAQGTALATAHPLEALASSPDSTPVSGR